MSYSTVNQVFVNKFSLRLPLYHTGDESCKLVITSKISKQKSVSYIYI